MKHSFVVILSVLLFACASARKSSDISFQRRYKESEKLKYRIQMTYFYDGVASSSYDAIAVGTVKKNYQNSFFEEFEWIAVSHDGKAVSLSNDVKTFRQILSLAPPFLLSIPDAESLAKLRPFLTGPVTDLLTFYVDESLLFRMPSLKKPGDQIYLPTSIVSSWGPGQDCLDFNVKITGIDELNKIGTIQVNHLPPKKICITPPEEWMKVALTEVPNNWYSIEQAGEQWEASFGKETFVVNQRVDLNTGIILSATMDNPIVLKTRNCKFFKKGRLSNCSKPMNHAITRKLTLTLASE